MCTKSWVMGFFMVAIIKLWFRANRAAKHQQSDSRQKKKNNILCKSFWLWEQKPAVLSEGGSCLSVPNPRTNKKTNEWEREREMKKRTKPIDGKHIAFESCANFSRCHENCCLCSQTKSKWNYLKSPTIPFLTIIRNKLFDLTSVWFAPEH